MENHRLQVVNKVTQNPYLLAYIFKFTSCQTQLKLIKISGYFQYVIQYHIWKVKYQNLKIEEDKPSYTIASVKPEEILRQIHFQEFLYLSVDIIKQLSISSYSYQQRSIIFQLERKSLLKVVKIGHIERLYTTTIGRARAYQTQNISKSFKR
ncbi:hypothetical protein FF38_01079 [Lucilia cuprina]|uniref:Uncharacterized protein n=1 Tax=Lucilia cuprina TaxID=7375 RepID=A0A0L0CF15_LUCCU|nr:hypothetical protein FF38_01079 [Lucilia cuprina]